MPRPVYVIPDIFQVPLELFGKTIYPAKEFNTSACNDMQHIKPIPNMYIGLEGLFRSLGASNYAINSDLHLLSYNWLSSPKLAAQYIYNTYKSSLLSADSLNESVEEIGDTNPSIDNSNFISFIGVGYGGIVLATLVHMLVHNGGLNPHSFKVVYVGTPFRGFAGSLLEGLAHPDAFFNLFVPESEGCEFMTLEAGNTNPTPFIDRTNSETSSEILSQACSENLSQPEVDDSNHEIVHEDESFCGVETSDEALTCEDEVDVVQESIVDDLRNDERDDDFPDDSPKSNTCETTSFNVMQKSSSSERLTRPARNPSISKNPVLSSDITNAVLLFWEGDSIAFLTPSTHGDEPISLIVSSPAESEAVEESSTNPLQRSFIHKVYSSLATERGNDTKNCKEVLCGQLVSGRPEYQQSIFSRFSKLISDISHRHGDEPPVVHTLRKRLVKQLDDGTDLKDSYPVFNKSYLDLHSFLMGCDSNNREDMRCEQEGDLFESSSENNVIEQDNTPTSCGDLNYFFFVDGHELDVMVVHGRKYDTSVVLHATVPDSLPLSRGGVLSIHHLIQSSMNVYTPQLRKECPDDFDESNTLHTLCHRNGDGLILYTPTLLSEEHRNAQKISNDNQTHTASPHLKQLSVKALHSEILHCIDATKAIMKFIGSDKLSIRNVKRLYESKTKDRASGLKVRKSPIVLVPGIGGTTLLGRHKKSGKTITIWPSVVNFDSRIRWLGWGFTNEEGDFTCLDPEWEVIIPQDDPTGLYPIEILSPDLPKAVAEPIAGYFSKIGNRLREKHNYTPGVNLFGFGYDWRRDIYSQKFLNEVHHCVVRAYTAAGNEKVILIPHSLGCLVCEAYLTMVPDAFKYVKKTINICPPFGGASAIIQAAFLSGYNLRLPTSIVAHSSVRQVQCKCAGTLAMQPRTDLSSVPEFWVYFNLNGQWKRYSLSHPPTNKERYSREIVEPDEDVQKAVACPNASIEDPLVTYKEYGRALSFVEAKGESNSFAESDDDFSDLGQSSDITDKSSSLVTNIMTRRRSTQIGGNHLLRQGWLMNRPLDGAGSSSESGDISSSSSTPVVRRSPAPSISAALVGSPPHSGASTPLNTGSFVSSSLGMSSSSLTGSNTTNSLRTVGGPLDTVDALGAKRTIVPRNSASVIRRVERLRKQAKSLKTTVRNVDGPWNWTDSDPQLQALKEGSSGHAFELWDNVARTEPENAHEPTGIITKSWDESFNGVGPWANDFEYDELFQFPDDLWKQIEKKQADIRSPEIQDKCHEAIRNGFKNYVIKGSGIPTPAGIVFPEEVKNPEDITLQPVKYLYCDGDASILASQTENGVVPINGGVATVIGGEHMGIMFDRHCLRMISEYLED